MPVDLKSTAKLHVFETPGSEAKDPRRDTGQMPAALRDEKLIGSLIDAVSKLDGNVQSLSKAVITIGLDVTEVKTDVATLKDAKEAEARKTSGAIRAVSGDVARESQANHDQDAAIANIVTDVAALKETNKTQLAILERLDKVAANPMVRRVAYAVAVAVLGYFAATGRR